MPEIGRKRITGEGGSSTALLMNSVAPYHLPLLRKIDQEVDRLTVFVSTPRAPDRPWEADWSGLDVRLQRAFTLRRPWRHPAGFVDRVFITFPYDTIPLLYRGKFDVIISTEMGPRSILAGIYRILRPRCRFLLWLGLSEHTEQGRGALREFIRRVGVRVADGLIVNGGSGASYLRGLGVAPDRIYQVPYTTDNARFERIPLQRPDRRSERRLLIVGQLTERKGVVVFLKALARWAQARRDVDVEVWVVGDGPDRDEIERAPVPTNVSVKVAGVVPYPELPSVYAQGGILAFPTFADEWGLVVNEALASGLPVLGSIYSQAVVELVEPGKTGWLFRPDEPTSLQAGLDAVFRTGDEELAAMRDLCRQKARQVSPQAASARMIKAIRGERSA